MQTSEILPGPSSNESEPLGTVRRLISRRMFSRSESDHRAVDSPGHSRTRKNSGSGSLRSRGCSSHRPIRPSSFPWQGIRPMNSLFEKIADSHSLRKRVGITRSALGCARWKWQRSTSDARPRANMIRKGASVIVAVTARAYPGIAACISGWVWNRSIPLRQAHLFSAANHLRTSLRPGDHFPVYASSMLFRQQVL